MQSETRSGRSWPFQELFAGNGSNPLPVLTRKEPFLGLLALVSTRHRRAQIPRSTKRVLRRQEPAPAYKGFQAVFPNLRSVRRPAGAFRLEAPSALYGPLLACLSFDSVW